MVHRNIKLAILSKFDSQADFAPVVDSHESTISRIIRGRRKLSREEAEKWRLVLGCDPSILEGITRDHPSP